MSNWPYRTDQKLTRLIQDSNRRKMEAHIHVCNTFDNNVRGSEVPRLSRRPQGLLYYRAVERHPRLLDG